MQENGNEEWKSEATKEPKRSLQSPKPLEVIAMMKTTTQTDTTANLTRNCFGSPIWVPHLCFALSKI
jgi:hypothetical protein